MMKKMICNLFSVIAMMAMPSGCQSYEDISMILGADVSAAKVVSEMDTHSGFHGDGEKYMEFQFKDDTFENTIKEDNTWHSLPLQDDVITALFYGLEMDGAVYGPYLWSEQGEPLMPNVENGYYLFYDRHPESSVPFNSTGVLERSSLNFTAALYDADAEILYYVELDT